MLWEELELRRLRRPLVVQIHERAHAAAAAGASDKDVSIGVSVGVVERGARVCDGDAPPCRQRERRGARSRRVGAEAIVPANEFRRRQVGARCNISIDAQHARLGADDQIDVAVVIEVAERHRRRALALSGECIADGLSRMTIEPPQ